MKLTFETQFELLSELPIREIDHPAITICSQGAIESLTEKAVRKQFENHILSKYGINISNGTDIVNTTVNDIKGSTKEGFWNEYLNDLYPGLKTSPAKIARILRPGLDPNEYIQTKAWIDPESVCTNDVEKEDCDYPWSTLSNGLCFRNMGQGLGSEKRCETIGGQEISIDPELWQNFEDLSCMKKFGYERHWDIADVKHGNVLDFSPKWGKEYLIEYEFTVSEPLHPYCKFPSGNCNFNIFEVSCNSCMMN